MNKGNINIVVLGGGFMGLLVAAILAPLVGKVTIIERGVYPSKPEPRSEQPKSKHLHLLLVGGLLILDRLFPELIANLVEYGAVKVKWYEEVLVHVSTGSVPVFDFGHSSLNLTLYQLEFAILRLIRSKYQNVEIVEGAEVTGLIHKEGKIVGAYYRPTKNRTQKPQRIYANLVVSATGRGQHAVRWLEEIKGAVLPTIERLDAHIVYCTCLFRPTEGYLEMRKTISIPSDPPELQSGGSLTLVTIDNEPVWVVTLYGVRDSAPPSKGIAEFVQYALELNAPDIGDMIVDAEPISEDISIFTNTSNVFVHFDQLKRSQLVSGLVVIGDELISPDPIYGQGLTIAILLGVALRECVSQALKEQRSIQDIGFDFYRMVKPVVSMPWLLATSSDSQFLGVSGAKTDVTVAISQAYIRAIIESLPADIGLSRTFTEVVQMVKSPDELSPSSEDSPFTFTDAVKMVRSPTALFHPLIIWKVVRRMLNI